MNKKRKQNEKEYKKWRELENMGRIYIKIVEARDGSKKSAHYEKTVDRNEKTIFFSQKIYDRLGNLLEIHEKFPIDRGHIILTVFLFLIFGLTSYYIF